MAGEIIKLPGVKVQEAMLSNTLMSALSCWSIGRLI